MTSNGLSFIRCKAVNFELEQYAIALSPVTNGQKVRIARIKEKNDWDLPPPWLRLAFPDS